jgi:integrase
MNTVSEGHRQKLLDGLRRFVVSTRQMAGVQRIAILGSIVTTKLDPKDIDVLVVVTDDADLTPLAASARRLQGHAQSFNRGADVFLADQRGTYIGRTCREHPLEPFVTVALGCGLRLGEALGLQWADVDLDAGTLQVRRAVQRFGGDAAARRPLLAERKRLRAALKATPHTDAADTRAQLAQELQKVRIAFRAVKTSVQITDLKSARSRRTIALPAIAITALRSHWTRRLEARLAAGGRWQDRGFVLTSAIGTALEPRNVTRQFKALLKAAKLPDMRLHDLRHSCATLLLAQGVNPRVVMETLGHSQVSLTLNTYSHVLPALQVDAASRMDAILSRH